MYEPDGFSVSTGAILNKGGRDFRTLAAYQDGSPCRVQSLATLAVKQLEKTVPFENDRG